MTVSSTSSSNDSSTAASLMINGLISGISTQTVIQALLQSYQAPITNLEDQQTEYNSEASEYQTINSDMQAVLNAAEALNTSSSWNLMDATSSDESVASASASAGAAAGTISFTVNQLAEGNLLVSAGSVASTSANVTSENQMLIGVGTEALGIDGLSNSSLALGSHTIEVTQSSQAATVTGSAAPAGTTTIATGQNDQLDVDVDGTSYNLTLAAGPYSASGLASAINQAATTAEAGLTASVNADGEVQLSTSEQGSAATLQVTGGDALSSLGLSSGSQVTGADAVVDVDGTSTTLSSVTAGDTVVLNAPSGSLTATIASTPGSSGSLLAAGSATTTEITTGSGSLADVVSAINGSGIAATASAVEQSDGGYRLQVAANQTGLAGAITLDGDLVSGGSLGEMNEVTAAQDAQVNVGGADGYTLDSSTNNFTSLLSGTTVTVAQTGTTTVNVSPDASAEATNVQTLVTAANQALTDIQTVSGYDETTKEGGPLMGSAILSNLTDEITSIFASVSGTSGLGSSENVGITLNSDGSLSFDSSTFESAFSSDPTAVESLFTQDGSFAPSSTTPQASVSLLYAGDNTASGTYDVTITNSATQATDVGETSASGSVSTPETLQISSDGLNASYQTTAGESLASIAEGLNEAFGEQGLGLSASVTSDGTALQIQSDQYGSAQNFSVTSSAAGSGTTGLGGPTADSASTYTGTDVAGTINGVTATGTGQVLAAPASDPTLGGLIVDVSASGITSPTDIGSFTFSAGLAQQLTSLASQASNAQSGALTVAAQGLTEEASNLDSQITMYQGFESSQQTALQGEFTNMEDALGQLKNEGSELTSEIDQL